MPWVKDLECGIIKNDKVAHDTYLLTLKCSEGIDAWMPGQFVMIKVASAIHPFLRRPFAILGYSDGLLDVLYKVIGQGTYTLSNMHSGDKLWVFGPLGKGFCLPEANEEIFYVAGGTGLPPIFSLAHHLEKGHILIGAKTMNGLALVKTICNIPNIKASFTTEDGSFGSKGLVTDVLEKSVNTSPSIIYACGPYDMLKKTYMIAKRYGTRCQVSLEEHMACGFGVCRGCVVETIAGNMQVCKDGPIFDATDIIWR